MRGTRVKPENKKGSREADHIAVVMFAQLYDWQQGGPQWTRTCGNITYDVSNEGIGNKAWEPLWYRYPNSNTANSENMVTEWHETDLRISDPTASHKFVRNDYVWRKLFCEFGKSESCVAPIHRECTLTTPAASWRHGVHQTRRTRRHLSFMLCMRNEADSDILYCSSYYIRIEAVRLGNADANAMSSSKTFLVIIPRSQCPSSAQRVVVTNFIKANDSASRMRFSQFWQDNHVNSTYGIVQTRPASSRTVRNSVFLRFH